MDDVERTSQSHRNTIRQEEPGLIGIGMEPSFAIGQRALLVRHPDGNFLWDCIPLLDEAVIELVKGIGGISAIAISHPHFYTSMVEWSHAFDAPIYLHAADKQWVMRPDPAIEFWDGETKPLKNGLTLDPLWRALTVPFGGNVNQIVEPLVFGWRLHVPWLEDVVDESVKLLRDR